MQEQGGKIVRQERGEGNAFQYIWRFRQLLLANLQRTHVHFIYLSLSFPRNCVYSLHAKDLKKGFIEQSLVHGSVGICIVVKDVQF